MLPSADLLASLAMCPPAGSRWLHYKGGEYTVVGAAIDEASLEPLVVYTSVEGVTFARLLRSWAEHVRVPGSPQLSQRFRLIMPARSA